MNRNEQKMRDVLRRKQRQLKGKNNTFMVLAGEGVADPKAMGAIMKMAQRMEEARPLGYAR